MDNEKLELTQEEMSQEETLFGPPTDDEYIFPYVPDDAPYTQEIYDDMMPYDQSSDDDELMSQCASCNRCDHLSSILNRVAQVLKSKLSLTKKCTQIKKLL